jgi:hypothetical protein
MGRLVRRLAFAICGVIGIAIAGPSAKAQSPYDGVYKGTRERTEGPAESCPTKENVTVIINGRALRFIDSTLQRSSLEFEPDANGAFNITYNILGNTNVVIKGHATATSLEADVTNSSTKCRHHWHLAKEHPGQEPANSAAKPPK